MPHIQLCQSENINLSNTQVHYFTKHLRHYCLHKCECKLRNHFVVLCRIINIPTSQFKSCHHYNARYNTIDFHINFYESV